jgi:uncharacterized protein (TIGR02569 family)
VDAPPASVVRAFGAQGEPTRLLGGRDTAWRVGDVVFKPLDMAVPELEWQASVLSELVGGDVRVAPPLRSRCGALIVNGWTGWPWLVGRHAPQWFDVIAAGGRFHAALTSVPRPAHLLDSCSHRWAHADRVAWEEAAAPETSPSDLAWLLAARRPISLPSQMIHGDLSGNVLLADGQPPAVIDFSPYWRPKEYATAIVLVDAIAWHHANGQVLELLPSDKNQGTQLLIRAAIFRMLSDSDPAAGRRADRFRGESEPQ